LHTNDAPSAITRLLDLGIPPYLLNATLLGVMAQRLVRTLCPHCKQPHPARDSDNELWDHLVTPWKAARPKQLQRPQGCLECRMTGYSGRIGIYEILLMSPELRKLVNSEMNLASLREQANREGMKPLRISGAQKVAAGLTTLEEVLKTSPPADQT
ncbi:MAG: ATPase, T2SS/T4P/T4SS family, partial [Sideroxydans sp.]